VKDITYIRQEQDPGS